jgi:hypothetical protein
MSWLARILKPPKGGDRRAAKDVRSQVLALDPATIQIPDGHWQGAFVAVMEIGMERGTASLVAVADGTVSLYTSTGGGTIGGGEYLSVREAGERFLRSAAEAAPSMQHAADFPLPVAGTVRFHVRTPDGDTSAGVVESVLRARRHALARLYLAGQDVITEIRQLEEAGTRA